MGAGPASLQALGPPPPTWSTKARCARYPSRPPTRMGPPGRIQAAWKGHTALGGRQECVSKPLRTKRFSSVEFHSPVANF